MQKGPFANVVDSLLYYLKYKRNNLLQAGAFI